MSFECCGLYSSSVCRYIVEGLNTSGKKYLIQEDLQFLDDWKPPAWFTSEPDVTESARACSYYSS